MRRRKVDELILFEDDNFLEVWNNKDDKFVDEDGQVGDEGGNGRSGR